MYLKDLVTVLHQFSLRKSTCDSHTKTLQKVDGGSRSQRSQILAPGKYLHLSISIFWLCPFLFLFASSVIERKFSIWINNQAI